MVLFLRCSSTHLEGITEAVEPSEPPENGGDLAQIDEESSIGHQVEIVKR